MGLYLLVKADVRSCEYLSTSANPDCGILDEGQGASQEHNGPTLCGSRNLLEDQEFEESADTRSEFVCICRGYMRPHERVVVREDARNDDSRQVEASSGC